MVVVCLPSDALSQHLSYYLGVSYLGRGVSLHSCSSKEQLLLLTLEEGYLLIAAPPDPEVEWLLVALLLLRSSHSLGGGVAPLGQGP